jgi:hypothetical protein
MDAADVRNVAHVQVGTKGVSVPAEMSGPSVGGPLTRYPSHCMDDRAPVAACSHAQSVYTDVTRLGSLAAHAIANEFLYVPTGLASTL